MGTVIKTTLQTSSSDFNVSVYAVLQSLELDGTLTVRINHATKESCKVKSDNARKANEREYEETLMLNAFLPKKKY